MFFTVALSAQYGIFGATRCHPSAIWVVQFHERFASSCLITLGNPFGFYVVVSARRKKAEGRRGLFDWRTGVLKYE